MTLEQAIRKVQDLVDNYEFDDDEAEALEALIACCVVSAKLGQRLTMQCEVTFKRTGEAN